MDKLFAEIVARSNVGKKRKNNEDNFYLNNETVDSELDKKSYLNAKSEFVAAVFDGMGGEASGEIASQLAAESLANNKDQLLKESFSVSAIKKAINAANNSVCNEMLKNQKRMGTTYSLLGYKNNRVTVANVGDSRIYLLRNSKLTQLSKDHTEAQIMVDTGLISYEASQHLKEKHKLTQHIGIFPEEMILEPYIASFSVSEDDIILLCSDGLTDMLTNEKIESIINACTDISQIGDELVNAALQNGGKDNITVMVVKFYSATKKENNANVYKRICIILAIILFLETIALFVMCGKNSLNKTSGEVITAEQSAELTEQLKEQISYN